MSVILDLFFPKRCVSCGKIGAYLCSTCYLKVEMVTHPVCPYCLRQAVGGRVHPRCKKPYGLDGLVIACRYKGPVKLLIRKLKYKWVSNIRDVLIELLVANISRFDLPKDAYLVPVPLHPRRKKWRGFNQSELLTLELCRRFDTKGVDVLERVRDTKNQVGLAAKERRVNTRDAFEVKVKGKVKSERYILVDDVYTTGATMKECAKVLKRAGAKEVWGMVVALG